TDERVAVLVIAEIFRADRARGHEAVGAGIVELHKKASARCPGDVAGKGRTDAISEEMRDEAVEGLAFGLHGAALGGGDLRADLTDRRRVLLLRQPAVTEPTRANETAVDDEVGIAADRRGEMRIAAQIQAEMPVIVRRIFGLRLRAQHNLIDKLVDVAAFHPREGAAKRLGAPRTALGRADGEAPQEIAPRVRP